MWIERLVLTDFRNHAQLALQLDRRPVVLAGPNGAGKTNVLEAVSLLAAGQGLRRAPYPELARQGGSGGWAVAATLAGPDGRIDIGTGLDAAAAATATARTGRIVRLDGEPQSGSGVLADHVEMVWLIPAMDGLFTGPAGERRRFLDRLVLCFDPGYRTRAGQFERAMRQRNRLLDDGVRDPALRGARGDHGGDGRRHRRGAGRGGGRAQGRHRGAPRARAGDAVPVGDAGARRHARAPAALAWNRPI